MSPVFFFFKGENGFVVVFSLLSLLSSVNICVTN